MRTITDANINEQYERRLLTIKMNGVTVWPLGYTLNTLLRPFKKNQTSAREPLKLLQDIHIWSLLLSSIIGWISRTDKGPKVIWSPEVTAFKNKEIKTISQKGHRDSQTKTETLLAKHKPGFQTISHSSASKGLLLDFYPQHLENAWRGMWGIEYVCVPACVHNVGVPVRACVCRCLCDAGREQGNESEGQT